MAESTEVGAEVEIVVGSSREGQEPKAKQKASNVEEKEHHKAELESNQRSQIYKLEGIVGGHLRHMHHRRYPLWDQLFMVTFYSKTRIRSRNCARIKTIHQ